MLSDLVREVEARRLVDATLGEALVMTPVGALVLIEVEKPLGQLPTRLLEAVQSQLEARASLHILNQRLFALVCPNATLFDGWRQVEGLRQHFAEHGVPVTVGLGAWPTHGLTTIDVFGAAIAALVDDRARLDELTAEEGALEVDGCEVRWASESDLLSG